MSQIRFFLLLFFIPATALAADAETATSGLSLWGLLKQGGWAMYPLGLCSLAMFFLIFYVWRETHRKKFIPDNLVPQLAEHLAHRETAAASQLFASAPTVLSRAMRAGLQRALPNARDANKEKVEAAVAESLEHEENGVNQWITYLNVVATVAPMIGLLGTVSGMIGAFQTIAGGGMGRPELLAGDIGEALITTATGLVIGIPAMVAYFILRNRLDNAMLATTQTATDLLDRLTAEFPAEIRSVEEPAEVS